MPRCREGRRPFCAVVAVCMSVTAARCSSPEEAVFTPGTIPQDTDGNEVCFVSL